MARPVSKRGKQQRLCDLWVPETWIVPILTAAEHHDQDPSEIVRLMMEGSLTLDLPNVPPPAPEGVSA